MFNGILYASSVEEEIFVEGHHFLQGSLWRFFGLLRGRFCVLLVRFEGLLFVFVLLDVYIGMF